MGVVWIKKHLHAWKANQERNLFVLVFFVSSVSQPLINKVIYVISLLRSLPKTLTRANFTKMPFMRRRKLKGEIDILKKTKMFSCVIDYIYFLTYAVGCNFSFYNYIKFQINLQQITFLYKIWEDLPYKKLIHTSRMEDYARMALTTFNHI